METIIRAPAMSSGTRRLRRSDVAKAPPQSSLQPPQSMVEARLAQPVAAPVVVPQFENLPPEVREEKIEVALPDPAIQLEMQRVRDQQLADERAVAEKQGYAQGLQQGEEAAKKAVAEQVERMMSVIATLHRAKATVLDDAEDAVVEIVYTAICRIIGDTAATRDGIVSTINQVLSTFREQDHLTVRLNPLDFQLTQLASGESDAAMIDPHTALRADTSVKLGGCMVDSEKGSLDATLDTQLDRLRSALLAARKSRARMEESV